VGKLPCTRAWSPSLLQLSSDKASTTILFQSRFRFSLVGKIFPDWATVS
jgi:hypothetical protein